ncbi:putative membrane protein YqiK [Wenyingzhuangia heitensis]|uniref:Membrane protein YqiK n=1 Tax=Wenyingzhuangia heitensis TaxID=1487859 RepID=A0ABX0UC22_9FLAO|nr:FeoB-associated Cys-rich membrane protein [Wenyingzhuangia heitensis]NIJ46377.1 putative membrane protein YqiK [Wenyingzhuangia heitensis]
MMWIQNILTIIVVAGALWFLYTKFIRKSKNNKNCGNDGCGC